MEVLDDEQPTYVDTGPDQAPIEMPIDVRPNEQITYYYSLGAPSGASSCCAG